MRYLIIACLFLYSCGSQDAPLDKKTRMDPTQEVTYIKLSGTVAEISGLILSDFKDCAQTGDSSDSLINKICTVAKASTVEAKVEMKAELAAAVENIQDDLAYVKSDLSSILDSAEEIDTRLTTAEATLVSLNTRVTALESQMTDITEGVCLRSRTTSPALDGSLVTFAWNSSVRMNSSYCTYNNPTAEYTIRKAGWYEITYKTNFEHTNGNTDLSYRSWILVDNTTQINASRAHSFTISDAQGELTTLSMSFIQNLSVGQLLEVQSDAADGTGAFGAGTASYKLIGTESFFMIKYIDD